MKILHKSCMNHKKAVLLHHENAMKNYGESRYVQPFLLTV